MKRSTKNDGQSANDGTNVRKKPGDIAEHPAMIALKEQVADLSPERREVLGDYLTGQAEAEDLTDQDDDPADDLSDPLDMADIVTLKQMIRWWRNREGSTVHEAPKHRPMFPGRRDNKGIRVNRRLMDAALQKARDEFPDATSGGKLSPTIEFLCWQFLGFDEKYLEINEDV